MRADLVIIGGGAAGLFAAALAVKYSRELNTKLSIILLEKMERCGRKIALTGKGRCNLTNTKPWGEFSSHVHPKANFFKSAFFGMSNLATMEFFKSLGLDLIVERGDRVFPVSMRAMDVSDCLLRYIETNGVRIIYNYKVEQITKSEDFTICGLGNNKSISCSKLILASGGLSYPTTGSTGDGYDLARKFGHSIVPCFPSLTALIPKNYDLKNLQGISLKNVEVQLFISGNLVVNEFGDLDFTNDGIEGPIGFKISRKAVQNIDNNQKVTVLLDLKPAVDIDKLKARINRFVEEFSMQNPNVNSKIGQAKLLNFLLAKLLPYSLLNAFLGANKDLNLANLAYKLKHWQFEIESYVGYRRAVITAGGINLAEVSQKTMESKLVPSLFFAGEILDLDGDTGGYNLQIAFSTAALAARSAVLCNK